VSAVGLRVGVHKGRLAVFTGNRALDVASASDGRFGPDPHDPFVDWPAFSAWLAGLDTVAADTVPYVDLDVGTPVPRPSQIFAIGLNYADHASESKMTLPEHPIVFTKFASSLAGSDVEVALTGDRVDWEAELVVVIGVGGRDIPESEAWDHVGGLAVGQDISDRTVQSRGSNAQFSLGKSFANFSPVSPYVPLAFLPEGVDRDALRIASTLLEVSGEMRELQNGTTADMVFPVPAIVARLSQIIEFRPGDLIFTGTPSGVGLGRDPQEFLAAGQTLSTEIAGIGYLLQRIIQKDLT
jgi:2,4-diketo-3-deoxy-L-fuconate hydrolase